MKDKKALKKIVVKKSRFESQPNTETDNIESYRHLLENVPIGLYRSQISDGKLLECNKRFAEILGYDSREECLTDFIAAERYVDLEARNRMLAEIRKHGEISDFDTEITAKDGSRLRLRFSAKIAPQRNCIEGFITNVSETKPAIEKQLQNNEQYHSIFQSANEEALHKSEMRYRSLVEDMPALICRFSPDGKLTFVNTVFAEFFNLTPDELIGENFFTYIPENRRKLMRYRYKSLSRKKSIFICEYEAINQKNKIHWQRWINRALFDENDRVLEYQSIGIDITRRKHVEETLQLEESRLEALLIINNMSEMSIQSIKDFALEEGVKLTKSKFGFLAFLNEDEEKLTVDSRSKNSLKQGNILSNKMEFDKDSSRFCTEAIRQKKPIITNNYSKPNPLKKGYSNDHIKLTRFIHVPILDRDNIVALVGAANKDDDYNDSDIRQLTLLMQGMWRQIKHIQAQEALKEREEHHRRIIETLNDGLGVQDKNGNLTYVNDKLCKMLGYQRDELTGHQIMDFLDDENRLIFQTQNDMREHEERSPYELDWTTKDGRRINTIISPSPLFDAKGHFENSFAVITDITDRKLAEKALRESEEKFREIVEMLPEVVWEIDANGMVKFINSRGLEISGYSQEDVDNGFNAVSFFIPADRKRLIQNIGKLIKGELYRFDDYTALRKDGSTFPVIAQAAAIIKEGKSVGVRGFLIDITERKKVEEEIKIAHAELKQILDSEPVSMRIIDKEFNVLRVNKSFCSLSGVSYNENFNLKCYEIFRGPKCLTSDCPLNLILKGDEYIEYDVERKRLDGKIIPCILSAVPFRGRNGELVGIIESFKDITKRKRAETELHRFGRAVKQSLDGIAMAGLDGNIQFINNAWAKMHLYNPKDVRGKHLRIFHTNVQLNNELLPILKRIEQGYDWEGEIGHMRKNGTVFPTWTTMALLKDSDDNPIGLVCNARDITNHKQAEKQLKKSISEKVVLLKEIHHRVKNNLQIISSLLELQSDYIKEGKAREIIKTSQDRVKLMALIHEQLYQSPDLSKIGFAAYIRELTNYLIASYGVNPDLIKFEKDIENIYLDVDTAIPYGLIINELITNSIKHAFPNNRPGTIYIKLRSMDNYFTITVSDDGIGFPDNLDFRNTKSLGLQLVSLLEKQTGFTIELDRSHGTTFKITGQKSECQ